MTQVFRALIQLGGVLIVSFNTDPLAGSSHESSNPTPQPQRIALSEKGHREEDCARWKAELAEKWVKAQPLSQALEQAQKSALAARQKKSGGRLVRLRQLLGELDSLHTLLDRPAAPEPTADQMSADQSPADCHWIDQDRSEAWTAYLSQHPLLEQAKEPTLAGDAARLREALRAFLDLPLFQIPSPDSCQLNENVRQFQWRTEPLRQAIRELSLAPTASLSQLRASVGGTDNGDAGEILGLLPEAACEQLAHIVCHHLRDARSAQAEPSLAGDAEGDPTQLARLGLRAASFRTAADELSKLRGRADELGCSPQHFGEDTVISYAQALLTDTSAALGKLDEAAVERVVQGLKRPDALEPEPLEERTRVAVDFLNLQHLEAAALLFAVAEPGLHYLEGSAQHEKSSTPHFRAVLDELGQEHASPDRFSQIREYEEFLGMLLMRQGEVCDLVSSRFARETLFLQDGVFAERGKALRDGVRSWCLDSAADSDSL